ncbi:uncharacterized protein LOC131583713 [Poecile atricapillus]|uniref:uncharacterized protein LOC131583713 n=1 Tax=Poecile atricapillus TaxID=48891 RepID=UPI00273854BD|nr:uncharacterized protein LOC131583713 [Poecile atricapillus]
MNRPCSQQESFPRSALHIGFFPSPMEPFRSLLWHVLVGFRGLQCTSWGFSQVLMLQYSHQTARRKHLRVISLSGHTQPQILENVQQLQLCKLQHTGNVCLHGERPAMEPCSGALSRCKIVVPSAPNGYLGPQCHTQKRCWAVIPGFQPFAVHPTTCACLEACVSKALEQLLATGVPQAEVSGSGALVFHQHSPLHCSTHL